MWFSAFSACCYAFKVLSEHYCSPLYKLKVAVLGSGEETSVDSLLRQKFALSAIVLLSMLAFAMITQQRSTDPNGQCHYGKDG